MANEEFKPSDVLFGEDVVERVKKRHDALKTLTAVKQPFQKGSTQKKNRFGHRENTGYSHLRGGSVSPRYCAGNFRAQEFFSQTFLQFPRKVANVAP